MKHSFASYLSVAINSTRKPLAYILVAIAPLLGLTKWSHASEAAIVMLGFILLPTFFEIHKKVTESTHSTTFESFQAASSTLQDEIDRLSKINGSLDICWLGLSGYHWPYIESSLSQLLKRPKIPKVTLKFILLDPSWDNLETINSSWRNQILGIKESVENFNINNRIAIENANWSINIQYYRSLPQILGVLINNSTLFFSLAYWDNDRLRGGHNPTELIKSTDGNFGEIRIKEFSDWFEYFWLKNICS